MWGTRRRVRGGGVEGLQVTGVDGAMAVRCGLWWVRVWVVMGVVMRWRMWMMDEDETRSVGVVGGRGCGEGWTEGDKSDR